MAGRCGCGGGACSCVLEVDETLTKEGNGSVAAPWHLSVNKDALFDDVAGLGLIYDEGADKFQVCLSGDTGNNLKFGTDGCLYAPGGDTPVPEVCARPIESLPAAPDVVGAHRMAGLIHPYSSPYGADYALYNSVDIITFNAFADADGVAVVVDASNGDVRATATSIPEAAYINELSTGTVQSVYNEAGDTADPNAGWYEWLAANYYQPFVADILKKIDAKAVALLQTSVDPAYQPVPVSEADNIQAAIRAVLQQCAQSWAMIGVSTITGATTVLNAGMTPVLGKEWETWPATWGETALPFPVADVTGAGIEWMALSNHYAGSVFQAYQAAGINVLMIGNSRQSEAARVAALGIRGALVMDPVYYRGPQAGADYRNASDAWTQRRMNVGQLTYRTDQNFVTADVNRGITTATEPGLIVTRNFGNDFGKASILLWKSPLTDPDDYTITWDMKWLTSAASAGRARMGLMFGGATDADTYDWPQNDPTNNPRAYPPGARAQYRCYQRQDGRIGIAKWNPGYTTLNEVTAPAMVVGEWNSYTLRVTPTQITFTRTAPGGAQYTAVTADTEFRGPYVFLEKEETSIGNDPNPFDGMFRNLMYTAA